MLNVGGSSPRQGPLVRRLTFAVNICQGDDCIEQVSPASEEKSMAPNA